MYGGSDLALDCLVGKVALMPDVRFLHLHLPGMILIGICRI
jgi:hypothetical protein